MPELAWQLPVLLMLLLLSMLFTASEIGFLSVSRSRVERMREDGGRLGGVIAYLHGHRALLLSVIILSITTCNYTAERIATNIGISALGTPWGPVVAAAIMTAIILTFCETTPMHWAASGPARAVRWTGGLVYFFSIILRPIVFVISGIVRLGLRLFGVRAATILPSVSEEQLKAMIEACEEQGELQACERRMLRGVLAFGDQRVKEVMTPRRDMVCVDLDATMQDVLDLGLGSRHTRLPIYDETPDSIVGIISLKDLLPYLARGEMDQPAKLAARPALHLLENLPADIALKQLQEARQLMAVVRDEYGGTAGLVTVEDLLEEIVGDILDEYDVEEPEVLAVAPDEYVCDATVSLRILANYIDAPLPVEDFDSLGGWLLDLAGRIPRAGESFQEDGLRFMVEQSSETRIEKVRVTELPESS